MNDANKEGKKINRSIKDKKYEAKNNNLSAIYDLYDYYLHGKYVQQNKQTADKYLNQLTKLVPEFNLKISEIRLINYKRIEDLTLKLDPNLTVIIGNNGYGKTSILDTIYISLTWLVNNIRFDNTKGNEIKTEDINNNVSDNYGSIITTLTLMKNNDFNLSLLKSKPTQIFSHKSNLQEVKQLAKIYRTLFNHSNNKLPVFAYYSVDRTKNESDRSKKDHYKVSSRLDVYKDIKISNLNYKNNVSWIQNLFDRSNSYYSYANLNNIGKIEKEISRLYDALFNKVKPPEFDEKAIEEKIRVLKKTYNELNYEFIKKTNSRSGICIYIENDRDPTAIEGELDSIKNIILEFLLSFDFQSIDFRYIKNDFDIFFTKNNIEVSFSQLSHGEKSIVSLVIDLSIRIMALNGTSTSRDIIKNTEGIVLIDEIELHLHPAWQQLVIPQLTTMFPKIQFIITTHSPNVLTTISRKKLKLLNVNVENRLELDYVDSESLGMEANDVLVNIMDVSPKPLKVPIVEDLEELSRLIDNEDEYDKNQEQISMLFDKVKEHYGHSYHQVDYLYFRYKLKQKKLIEK